MKVVLGIDPGFSVTGYCVVVHHNNQILLVDYGHLSMPSSKDLVERVGIFHALFSEKIKKYAVTLISLETPFLGKNPQTFLKLGYLRGVMYLLAHEHGLQVAEFAPREVKAAVTGFGGASKEQVAKVLKMLFPQMQDVTKEDITDSIAVGLCGVWYQHTLRK